MKKIIIFCGLLLPQVITCSEYEEKCYFQEPKTMNRRVINSTDIRARATYSYKNDERQTTCYVVLFDDSKRIIIEQLAKFRDKPLDQSLINLFPDGSTIKKVVFDFVTHKTKERNKNGSLFTTVQDILNVINPQGDQKALTGIGV